MTRFVLLAACLLGAGPAAAQAPPSVDREAPRWAVAVFPSGARFELEIAATPSQRRLGYMFREEVPAKEGMLFLFEAPDRHAIWMRNCKVALDIIWLDAEFRVVEIFPDAQPCPDDAPCPNMQPMQLADYVLEVAAGRAAEENLRLGDRVVIESEPAL